MKATKRIVDRWNERDYLDHGDGWGSSIGWGFLIDPNWGGYNNESPSGVGEGWGDGEGGSGARLNTHYLLKTNSEGRRTERIFRCAGCIGGYECSIHGRRL